MRNKRSTENQVDSDAMSSDSSDDDGYASRNVDGIRTYGKEPKTYVSMHTDWRLTRQLQIASILKPTEPKKAEMVFSPRTRSLLQKFSPMLEPIGWSLPEITDLISTCKHNEAEIKKKARTFLEKETEDESWTTVGISKKSKLKESEAGGLLLPFPNIISSISKKEEETQEKTQEKAQEKTQEKAQERAQERAQEIIREEVKENSVTNLRRNFNERTPGSSKRQSFNKNSEISNNPGTKPNVASDFTGSKNVDTPKEKYKKPDGKKTHQKKTWETRHVPPPPATEITTADRDVEKSQNHRHSSILAQQRLQNFPKSNKNSEAYNQNLPPKQPVQGPASRNTNSSRPPKAPQPAKQLWVPKKKELIDEVETINRAEEIEEQPPHQSDELFPSQDDSVRETTRKSTDPADPHKIPEKQAAPEPQQHAPNLDVEQDPVSHTVISPAYQKVTPEKDLPLFHSFSSRLYLPRDYISESKTPFVSFGSLGFSDPQQETVIETMDHLQEGTQVETFTIGAATQTYDQTQQAHTQTSPNATMVSLERNNWENSMNSKYSKDVGLERVEHHSSSWMNMSADVQNRRAPHYANPDLGSQTSGEPTYGDTYFGAQGDSGLRNDRPMTENEIRHHHHHHGLYPNQYHLPTQYATTAAYQQPPNPNSAAPFNQYYSYPHPHPQNMVRFARVAPLHTPPESDHHMAPSFENAEINQLARSSPPQAPSPPPTNSGGIYYSMEYAHQAAQQSARGAAYTAANTHRPRELGDPLTQQHHQQSQALRAQMMFTGGLEN